MLGQIGNVDELHRSAISALEIAKWLARAEHHLAGGVRPVILLVPAYLTRFTHIKLISRTKKW